jgi:hypothetical protein
MVAQVQLFFGVSCIREFRENAIDQTGAITNNLKKIKRHAQDFISERNSVTLLVAELESSLLLKVLPLLLPSLDV